MRVAWMTVAVAAVLSGCAAHERAIAGLAMACAEDKVELVASAPAKDFPTPRVVTPAQAQVGGEIARISSVAALLGATLTNLVLPAGTIQVSAPGWRQFEGCGRTVVCLDGGLCGYLEPAELQPIARRVPALMEKSLAEHRQRVAGPGCQDEVVLDRRGTLVWTMHACGKVVGCVAATADSYQCVGEGVAPQAPAAPEAPTSTM
ncbi:MAG: hypothetical protein AMXMBFR34_06070 [Myxococcaceae bacterium]